VFVLRRDNVKTLLKGREQKGFTFWELLVVVCCLCVLGFLLLPWPHGDPSRSKTQKCRDNLKQIGLGFLVWAHDNEGARLPIWVSSNQGGTLEYKNTDEIFRCFQALSNYLESPKYLVCPADTQHTVATNFATLQNSNLSYFINVGEDRKNAFAYGGDFSTVLAGDRNITGGGVTNNSMTIRSNSPIQWTSAMHKSSGNIVRLSGEVETWGANGWASYVGHRSPFQVALP
jgi:hypothetical protein